MHSITWNEAETLLFLVDQCSQSQITTKIIQKYIAAVYLQFLISTKFAGFI